MDCLRDELNTQVVFEENTNDDYPNMLIHSVGILAGKDVNVTQVVLFDRKNNRYNIPHFIQDQCKFYQIESYFYNVKEKDAGISPLMEEEYLCRLLKELACSLRLLA